jgi:hypothetical protein
MVPITFTEASLRSSNFQLQSVVSLDGDSVDSDGRAGGAHSILLQL